MPQPQHRRRWHPLAITMAAGLAIVFTYGNSCGSLVAKPDIPLDRQISFDFDVYAFLEYGWPLTFLVRDGHDPDMQNRIEYSGRRAGEVLSFEPLPLTLDLLLAMALTVTVGSLANGRLKTRGPQFTLKEFSIVVLMVSLATVYLVDRWKMHQAQEAILDKIGTTSLFAKWQPFGPYWLRERTGHRYWSWGDLLVRVDIDHSDQLPKIPGKRSIRVLSIRTIRGESVPALDGFTNLQAIDLSRINYDYGNVENKFQAELWHFFLGVGRCQSLEGLNLYDAKVTNQGVTQLAGLGNLRHLDLSGNLDIDDRGIACLKSLTNLRSLHLSETSVSPAGVANLRRALPHCEVEWE